MKKRYLMTGASFMALMSQGMVVQAADSVNVSMPTNNPPVSEYKITLSSQSGKDWTYKVEWVRGKALSHWDLSLGSCLAKVTSISNGGTKQDAGDPSNANPANGADSSVKGSKLIKWDTQGGTFTVTMDKEYQSTQVPVLAKTATVYNTGMVTGPDCTKEVAATPPAPAMNLLSGDSGGNNCYADVNGSRTQINVTGRLAVSAGQSGLPYNASSVMAQITNNTGKPQQVTLVTYKEYYEHENFANVFDAKGTLIKSGQTVYDYKTVMAPAGTSQLEVAMPGCATQVDLVCNSVIDYLGNELYGNRKLAWYHAHQSANSKEV